MKLQFWYVVSFVLALAFSPFASALDLKQAKERGLVGEMANGYLGTPQMSTSPEVGSLIKDINAKRKAKYQEVAKKVGKSLQIVEQLAGEKAQGKTKAGHFIRDKNGKWSKR